MKEVIISHALDNSSREQQDAENFRLNNCPDSVQNLFEQLPSHIKRKIFIKIEGGQGPHSSPKNEVSLEELIASFDTKMIENFMTTSLHNLFEKANLKDRLENANKSQLCSEIDRLLNLIWANRGNHNNEIVFNKDYYDNFQQYRGNINEKIKEKKAEIEELRRSIEKTRTQKRLTETKINQLRFLEKEGLNLFNKLDKYDRENGNSDLDRTYFRDIASRKSQEKQWMNAVIITSEYLSPLDFGVAMQGQLNKTFYKENSIAMSPNGIFMGNKYSEQSIISAKNTVKAISQACENWYRAHENEDSLKKVIDEKTGAKQEKLINYFISLLNSYQRGSELKQSEDDMVYTIKQIEVALNILKKS